MRTLRSRITAIATAAFLIVLAVAVYAVVALTSQQLRNDLQAQNERTIDQISERIARGDDPRRIALPFGSDGTEFLIFDAQGDTINSTLVAVSEETHADAEEFMEVFDFDEFATAHRDAIALDGSLYTVYALNPTAVVERSVDKVQTALWIAVPLLTAVFAALVWFLTGRTLRPVGLITAQARRIRTETLHERVEHPGTDDEIGRLADTVNSMLDRLDQGARTQRQFVSDASHELQSPLTVMLGEAELAAANPTLQRLAQANTKVIEHGKRLRDLVADLLHLARADEASSSRQHRDIDLDDVVRVQARLVSDAIDTSGVTPARMVGDEPSVARAVRNLLDNAVHHGNGTVQVACGPGAEGGVVLTVDDDGPGIPLSHRETVFDRFARVDSSRARQSGGTGLGLAIVHAVATAHNGTVEVSDAPTGGARFTMSFPEDTKKAGAG